MRRLLILLLFALPLYAQTPVTVTGTVTDNSNTAATSGYVQFDIQPSSGALHYYVPGVTSVAPQTAQCGIDGTGHVKNLTILTNPCTIWGNDALTPGNSTYKVTFAPNGNVTNVVSGEKITGVSYNLNNPVFAPIVQITPQQNIIRSNPFQVNITPIATNTFNIGSPALQYANGYFQNITIGSAFSAPVLTTNTLVASVSVTTPVINNIGYHQQIFTASGGFTVPAGVTQIKITAIGAGGGGGGSTAGSNGCGGGAGSYGIKWYTGMIPGDTIIVVIGTGGTGGNGTFGTNGTGTTISGGTQPMTNIITNGGIGGVGGVGIFQGCGLGGAVGTGGDINIAGGSAIATFIAGSGSNGGSSFLGHAPQYGASCANSITPGTGGNGCNSGSTLTGGNAPNGFAIFEWVQ